MTIPAENRHSQANEREIAALSDRLGASHSHVRTLFSQELARLQMGAKVGSYVDVLTAANVRGMLQRKARLAAEHAHEIASEGRDPPSRAPSSH
jgi:hypothetical protein